MPSQSKLLYDESKSVWSEISLMTDIVDLETAIDNIVDMDEKVKIDVNDTAGYLGDKIDGTTIQKSNNKIVAKSLDGLNASIEELNYLVGATSSIQEQINALIQVGHFIGSTETYADLNTLTPEENDMAIVLDDENRDNKSTIYMYNGTTWEFVGEFKGGEIRDFITHPINLTSEVTNILPKDKYVKQNATDTEVEDVSGVFTSSNVEGVLKELDNKINTVNEVSVKSVNGELPDSSGNIELSGNMKKEEIVFRNIAQRQSSFTFTPNRVKSEFIEFVYRNTVKVDPNAYTLNDNADGSYTLLLDDAVEIGGMVNVTLVRGLAVNSVPSSIELHHTVDNVDDKAVTPLAVKNYMERLKTIGFIVTNELKQGMQKVHIIVPFNCIIKSVDTSVMGIGVSNLDIQLQTSNDYSTWNNVLNSPIVILSGRNKADTITFNDDIVLFKGDALTINILTDSKCKNLSMNIEVEKQ